MNRGGILRARTQSAFMTSTTKQRLDFYTRGDIQSANTTRAVNFVRRNGQQIGSESVGAYCDFAESLNGIRVHTDPALFRSRRNLRDRLDAADFVVVPHHR